jgi:uncharacterized membrane protein YoaK (UPF0700 family)
MVAGSADVISFLGLHGLFVAHIIGNLVILAAHIVSGSPVGIAEAASVPVFVLVLGAVRLFAARLLSRGQKHSCAAARTAVGAVAGLPGAVGLRQNESRPDR